MAEPRRASAPPDPHAVGARVLVVEACFYDDIGGMLRAGAQAALAHAGATATLVSVPGALEIPTAIALALAHDAYDGVVALGCVIRGETYHFEIVAQTSAQALMALAVERKLPLGNGILTVEDERQAHVRADPAQGDKGGDAARAALALIALKRRVGAS